MSDQPETVTLHAADNRAVAERWSGYITNWRHTDGTRCDAGFLASTPRTNSGDHWGCTEHGKDLEVDEPDSTRLVTIHEARQHEDGPLYIRLDEGWYRISWTGSKEPSADKTRPVRIVTTDPGRHDGEPPAEIGALTRQLEAEKEAHAKTRENFAEHVGAEFPAPRDEISDDEFAAFNAGLRTLREPAGLSAEQEIRARALAAAVNMLADDDTGDPGGGESEVAVRWVLATADRFAGWIRDGSVPDAPKEQ